MHRAWEIEEIGNMIVENLKGTTLANFALVSRLFNALAVPFIWSDIRYIPLYHMAGSAIDVLNSDRIVEVKRLKFLLACVRTLHLDMGYLASLFLPHLSKLILTTPGGYLFTNLRSIFYEFSDGLTSRESLADLLPFLCPSLQNVTIMVQRGFGVSSHQFKKDIAILLHTLRTDCLHLTSLTLAGDKMPHVDELSGTIIQDLLARCSSLKMYKSNLTALNANILPILAQLPALREFAVQQNAAEQEGDFVKAASLRVMKSGFHSLRTLGLRMFRFVLASQILREIGSKVEILRVTIWSGRGNETGGKELVDLCGCIALLSATLKSLRVEIKVTRACDVVVSWRCLSPLLNCSHLESFHLYLAQRKPFDFTDCDLTSIAKSSRSLKSLIVDWNFDRDYQDGGEGCSLLHEDQLTLAGVAAVAQYCHALEELQIAGFHATDIPKAIITSRAARPVCLTVKYAAVEQPDLVAAFLLTVWPELEIIRSLPIPSENGPWQGVEEEVESRQRNRRMKPHRDGPMDCPTPGDDGR